MRKTVTTTAAAVALVLPTAQALAAQAATTAKPKPKPKTKTTVQTKTFTGALAQADQWGNIQVTVVMQKTTTAVGTKKTVARKITSITAPVYPDHTNRSLYISQQAIPMLVQEALQAQSARIYVISGATFTSDAFAQSLQATILASQVW